MADKDHIRHAVGLLLLVAFQMPLLSAGINRDSLARELHKVPENSEIRAELLYQLSISYRKDIPDEAILYGEQLLELAKRLESAELLYQGHMSTGVAYAIRGNAPETALQHFINALDIAKRDTGQEWGLRRVKSRINIAGVHWQMENIGQALAYAYENTAQLKDMAEPLTLADAYRSIALMHRTAENFDSTFLYLQQALDIYMAQKASYREASTLISLASTYQQTGLHEKARQLLYQAQAYAYHHQDSTLLWDTYEGLADAHLRLNRPDSAEFYARTLLSASQRGGLLPEIASGYHSLSELFTATHQPDSALYYFRQYAEVREQLINEEKTRAIQEMDTRYQAKEKALEIRSLREQYGQASFINTLLLIISILFLFLLAVIAFFNYRLRRRQEELESLNEEVVEINAKLLALMNEKKHMVSLIAHDIRNPLSLLQLNTHARAGGFALSEEERQEILKEMEQATTDIDHASLKIMEVENKTASQILIQNVNFDIVQAIKESVREFTPFAHSKSLSLQFHSNQGRAFLTGDPFLFRHIIANLLSNAIKYSPQNKTVEVTFLKKDSEALFSIKDEGPGLSQEQQQQLFQRGHTFHPGQAGGERSLGEGLYLTHRYIESMGGKISVDSSPGQGSTFSVRFPV